MSMEMEEKILEDAPTTFKSSSTKRALWIVVVTLAVVLVVSLAVVFALAIALGVEKADSSDDDTSAVEAPTSAAETPTSAVETPTPTPAVEAPVCLTPDCAQLSALVLSGLDETIEPCDNFYNFSCGSWVQNTIIPDGRFVYTGLDYVPVPVYYQSLRLLYVIMAQVMVIARAHRAVEGGKTA